MNRGLPKAIGYMLAVVVGAPAAMVAGAAVFSDGPPALSAERIVPIVAVYAVLGVIVGLVSRLVWASAKYWTWTVASSVLGLFAVALLGSDFGPGRQLIYMVVLLASAAFGTWAGALAAARIRPGVTDG